MSLSRKPDWTVHLYDYIEAQRSKRFKWGDHDCVLFACGAIKAMTGIDPAAGLRGKYKTKTAAFATIKELTGKGTVLALARWKTRELTMPEVDLLRAQRGDIVLIKTDQGDVLGVCIGAEVLAPGMTGLVALPLTDGKKAWRV